jgi:hypothetical protein
MNDDDGAIAEALNARPLTVGEGEALARVEHFVSRHDFVAQRRPRLAAELLVAGVFAAAIVSVILAVTRHAPTSPSPVRPPQPAVSSRATPTPSALPVITSTVVGSPPLILYWVGTTVQSYQFEARTYAGRSAGSLVIPTSGDGFEIAPNGARVLDGKQIINVQGSVTGSIAWTSPNLPMWADDSAHLCGATYNPGGQATLVEFDMSGNARTVTVLGPSSSQTSWFVLACSPSADRAVVVEQGNNPVVATIEVIRLSTGAHLGSHVVTDALSEVVSHDGRIVAVSESSGIAIRDVATWQLRARIVRWGSQAGLPLIGSATMMSWDGSRILIDGGGASGADHPMWFVDWAHDRNVLTSGSSPGPLLSGPGDVVPLIQGSSFFIRTGPTGDTLYLLRDNGSLQKIAG